ncbi:MAG: hypothetical protein V4510_10685 [bacterium]
MRLLLVAAFAFVTLTALAATSSASGPGTGGCTYTHYVDPDSGYIYVRQDCQSGITVCHTEVSGGGGQPFNVDRQCYY